MIRNYIYPILFFIPLVTSAQHTIKGEVKGAADSFTVYLKEFKNYDWVVLDSTVVKNQKFEFSLPDNDQLIYLDAKQQQNFYVKLYNVKGVTQLSYNLADNTYSLSGTPLNEGLKSYNDFIKPYENELTELAKQKPKIGNPSNFTVEERNAYLQHFLLEKKAKNNITLAKFEFISQDKSNEYAKILIKEKLAETFKEENYDLLEKFYNELNETDKNSENGKKLFSFLKEYEDVKIGAKVADFSLPDTNKKAKNLYKNLGKYTILDFWASWCGPCRQENPNTVALYNKYQKKGLKIIGISLDTDDQKWKNAIEKDQLTWLQLSNLSGWNDPLLQTFKITSIPKIFILDKKGTIIAKDLRGEELAKKIDELFTKK